MEKLYQEIILDHYRTPHHFGLRDPFDTEVHHVNPTCGDEVTLRVRLEPAGTVRERLGRRGRCGTWWSRDISYDALGCSISQASTSVLTDLAIGRPLDEVMSTLAEFTAMVTSRGKIDGDEDVLGDGIAFAGVSKYPARVKCALLGWMAFKDAAAQSLDQTQPAPTSARRSGPMTDTVHSTVGAIPDQPARPQATTTGHDHAGHRTMSTAPTAVPTNMDPDRAGRAAADLDKVVAAAPAAPRPTRS